MVIALKNNDLEVHFKTFGGELSSIRSKEGIQSIGQDKRRFCFLFAGVFVMAKCSII